MNEPIQSIPFKRARTPPLKNTVVPLAPLTTSASFTEGSAPAPIKQILWQGLDGQYLAIVENGLIQSMDGGRSWGYLRPNATLDSPAWPSGAIGHQLGWGIGMRSCDTPVISCDDFLDISSWSPTAISGASADIVTDTFLIQPDSLQIGIPGSGTGKATFEKSFANTDPGSGSVSFYFKTSSVKHTIFDVLIDGDFLFRISYDFLNKLTISDPPVSIEADIEGGIWNLVDITFDMATGMYLSFNINGKSINVSTIPAESVGSNPGFIDVKFEILDDGTAYESWWTEVCVGLSPEELPIWTSASIYTSASDWFLFSRPTPGSYDPMIVIGQNVDAVPILTTVDITATLLGSFSGQKGTEVDQGNPTFDVFTQVWLLEKNGPDPDWYIDGHSSSKTGGAAYVGTMFASKAYDHIEPIYSGDNGTTSAVQNGMGPVPLTMHLGAAVTAVDDQDIFFIFCPNQGGESHYAGFDSGTPLQEFIIGAVSPSSATIDISLEPDLPGFCYAGRVDIMTAYLATITIRIHP
jgi:hypothetical protein